MGDKSITRKENEKLKPKTNMEIKVKAKKEGTPGITIDKQDQKARTMEGFLE